MHYCHHDTVTLSHKCKWRRNDYTQCDGWLLYILKSLFWPERKKALPPGWHVVSHGDIMRGATLWEDPAHVV